MKVDDFLWSSPTVANLEISQGKEYFHDFLALFDSTITSSFCHLNRTRALHLIDDRIKKLSQKRTDLKKKGRLL